MLKEANFDGLVGPTHNYAGLSYGNTASTSNRGRASRPRDAVLQGLDKMEFMMGLGLWQGVLPPLERPHVPTLRRLGFSGDDASIVAKAYATDPVLLALCSSVSAMWTANAATVVPSEDSNDGRTHFAVANLRSLFHRSLEPPDTLRSLQATFPGDRFAHHAPLPGSHHMGDEGAANHTRLFTSSGTAHLFVYGHRAFGSGPAPERYPARQSLEASQAVARLTGLRAELATYAQQNPAAIDAGVFHNDVISVGNGNVLLYHTEAFVDGDETIERLRTALGDEFVPLAIDVNDVSLMDAVQSYLFNSQLLTRPDGSMCLVCPTECEENANVFRELTRIVESDNPIDRVHYLNLRESMRNGGGPACLRLRVALDGDSWESVNPGSRIDEPKLRQLRDWANKHYREELRPEDLGDPALLHESRTALDELTRILGLGSLYHFQRSGA